MARVVTFLVCLGIGWTVGVGAQNLASCAQGCVGVLTTNCKPTDYICMCDTSDYISSLSACIFNDCDETESAAAIEFLEELCSAVGSPISISHKDASEISADASENEALEVEWKGMNDHPLELRQENTIFEQTETGFPGIPVETTTSNTFIGTSTGTLTGTRTAVGTGTNTKNTGSPTTGGPTSATTTPAQTGGGGGGSGGLSTGAKVGIGLGVPLGVILIGALVGLGWFLRRRSKKQAATAVGAQTQPQMMGPGMPELSGQGVPVGSEMPTKANAHEMPAGAWMGQGQSPAMYGQGQPQVQHAPADLGGNR